ncbi:MFS transporter [Streptomyces sp. NPDC004296]|uniref:MFS transporter n=1 Tax=Streptomyces sp. NPDC004296 TaxID=3364697 RepID=UPI00367FB8C1
MTHDQEVRKPAVPAGEQAPAARGRPAMVATVVFLLFTVMLGGALPTPLYGLYSARLGLTPVLVTVVFALYAVGVVAALLLGGVSDRIGRRAVIGPAMLVAAASCAVFAVFPTLPGLLAGRLLSGISVGLATGASTAYLRELHPRPATAALLATVTSMLGLAGGPLLGGVLAEFAPRPLLTPYLVMAALLLSGLVLFRLPETVIRTQGPVRVQRLAVPPQARGVFTAVAVSVFAGFSVLGLLAGLTGTFLAQGLHRHSPLLTGLVAGCAFAAAGLAQVVSARAEAVRATVVGMSMIPVGLALIIAALPARSLTLFLAGAALGGGGAGAAFRSGLAALTARVPAARTGEVASSYFVAAYLGLTLPVIGVAVLLSWFSLVTAAGVFAGVVTLLALAGIRSALTLRRKGD